MKPNRENKSTGLLVKHFLIGHCLLHPKTSKGDAAVLWYLIERYNDEIGAAWPGLNNIATYTRLDRKTVQRSITRLVAENFLTVERGGRAYKGAPGKSNRYHPNFALGASTPLVSNNEVGAQVSDIRGVHAHEVGTPTPPDPSLYSGLKAGIYKEGTEEATASAVTGAAVGRPPPPRGGAPHRSAGRRFEEFWQAYPPKPGARTGPVEDQIEVLLEEGIQLDAIVAGAQAYAASIRAKPFHDSKYTRQPKNWLTESGWLDDYAIHKPTTPPQASSKATKEGRYAKANALVKHELTVPNAFYLDICTKEKNLKKISETFRTTYKTKSKGAHVQPAIDRALGRAKKWALDKGIITLDSDGKNIILNGRADGENYWKV